MFFSRLDASSKEPECFYCINEQLRTFHGLYGLYEETHVWKAALKLIQLFACSEHTASLFKRFVLTRWVFNFDYAREHLIDLFSTVCREVTNWMFEFWIYLFRNYLLRWNFRNIFRTMWNNNLSSLKLLKKKKRSTN